YRRNWNRRTQRRPAADIFYTHQTHRESSVSGRHSHRGRRAQHRSNQSHRGLVQCPCTLARVHPRGKRTRPSRSHFHVLITTCYFDGELFGFFSDLFRFKFCSLGVNSIIDTMSLKKPNNRSSSDTEIDILRNSSPQCFSSTKGT